MTLLRRSFESLFKAAPPRPPLGVATGSGLSSLGGGVSGTNPVTQMSAMTNTSWLFAVVDRISASAASVPWGLFRRMPDGQSQLVPQHPILDLWSAVNPFYTRHEFIETSIQHYSLTGEIWWLIVRDRRKQPVELWPIRRSTWLAICIP